MLLRGLTAGNPHPRPTSSDSFPVADERILLVVGWIAAGILGVAIFSLAAGVSGHPEMTRLAPGWPPVRPVAVIALLGLGVTLTAIGNRRWRRVARDASFLPIAAGTGALVEWIAGPGALPVGTGGWFAAGAPPHAALAFVMLGLAANHLARRGEEPSAFRDGAAIAAAAVGYVALIGYTFDIADLYHVGTRVEMALLTALALFAAGLAILLTGAGPVRGLIESELAAPRLVRRVLPLVLLVPVLLGLLRIIGQNAGLFSFETGVGLMVIASSSLIVAVLLAAGMAGTRLETSRLESERALAEANRLFRRVVEATTEGVLILDAQGSIVYLNRAMVDLLDRDAAGLIGAPAADLLDLESITAADQHPTEVSLPRADGAERWVLVRSSRLQNGQAEGWVLVAADVTEERRAREALRASEANYRELVEHATHGIIRSDEQGRILTANRALAEMLGTSLDALIGTPISTYYADEDERERVKALISDRPYRGLEVNWQRADGAGIVVRLSGRAVGAPGRDRYFETIAEDVTSFRELEDQLRHAQKMEAIGRLAGGIAHDFNNVLTALRGHLSFAREELDASHPAHEDVSEAMRAVDRAAGLTRELLAFGRRQVFKLRPVQLDKTILALRLMLERLCGEAVALELELEPDMPPAMVDVGQLEQVIVNLVVNARDAMPDGGTVRIRTSGSSDRHDAFIHVEVIDTGVGIDPKDLTRIFEPFYTTKPAGKGTGLGLSTVYGIVRQSGGSIDVRSEPGRGTTFHIALPIAAGARVEAPDRPRREPAPSGSESVLVADDDDTIAHVARRVLERAGYRVLVVNGLVEAQRVAATPGTLIDLLLTDLVMKDGNGIEVADVVREIHPGAAVVFMSGYGGEVLDEQLTLPQDHVLLDKPFTPEDLLRTVRSALDRESS